MKTFKLLLLIIIIFTIGTLGYVAIEGWSFFDAFYMTAISITTVGFGETKPLSEVGKLFTILIIFLGLGAAAVFASHLAKAFLESHFKNLFGANKMLKKINRLRDHYIICGYGGVGSAICGTLNDAGIKFVVVEQNEDVAQWAEKRDLLTVIGKATYDTTLLQAGIKNAKGIVVSMGDDSLNMYVSLAARELNPEIFIIARGYKSDIESRLVRAGANTVVYPIKMGGEQIAHLIKRQLRSSNSSDDNNGAGLSVMGYTLRPYKHYGELNVSIGDLKKRMKAQNIVTLKRVSGEEIQAPTDEILVHKNDSLLLVVSDVPALDRQVVSEDSMFYWSDKYSVGNAKMDLEHEKLFHIIYDFVTSINSGSDKEVITIGFNRIIENTIEHFDNEEKLFSQYNYPHKREHIKVHKEVLSSIKALNKDREYNFSMGIEEALFSSLLEHIMDSDKKFTDYIKENFHG